MIARFLFTAAHALFWAATDARDIRNGKDIKHGFRWALRAAVEVGATLAVMPFGWGAVMTTLAAAFLFSALFRFLLNTMRGRHWNYISPSNAYDRLWIRSYSIIDGTQYELGSWGYKTTPSGTLAYIFEAVVFALLGWIA